VYDSINLKTANSSQFMGYQNYTKLLEIYLMLVSFQELVQLLMINRVNDKVKKYFFTS